jgi:hypothetical protein
METVTKPGSWRFENDPQNHPMSNFLAIRCFQIFFPLAPPMWWCAFPRRVFHPRNAKVQSPSAQSQGGRPRSSGSSPGTAKSHQPRCRVPVKTPDRVTVPYLISRDSPISRDSGSPSCSQLSGSGVAP